METPIHVLFSTSTCNAIAGLGLFWRLRCLSFLGFLVVWWFGIDNILAKRALTLELSCTKQIMQDGLRDHVPSLWMYLDPAGLIQVFAALPTKPCRFCAGPCIEEGINIPQREFQLLLLLRRRRRRLLLLLLCFWGGLSRRGFAAKHLRLLQTFVAKWPPRPVASLMLLIRCHTYVCWRMAAVSRIVSGVSVWGCHQEAVKEHGPGAFTGQIQARFPYPKEIDYAKRG